MNKVDNFHALTQLTEEELNTILGNSKQAALLHSFLHQKKSDLVLDIKTKSSSINNPSWKKRR